MPTLREPVEPINDSRDLPGVVPYPLAGRNEDGRNRPPFNDASLEFDN